MWPAAHLAVFAYSQTSEVTQQTAQVLFKQACISQVFSRQVHKLVGVHHLAWRKVQVQLQKSMIMTKYELKVRGLLSTALLCHTAASEQTFKLSCMKRE